ncbi:putative transporter [Anaerohalosphaera lusitana]|uniref:Putative transporter n=1 Tax=Anaerohalosphaera lusitana TaxID=1936003 RepID=A0A1U9NKP3_9BACT|nr:LamG-like jellyroll fold domain-containing protein [Anaerohalosphaera lusitana]AQT68160.1 putative transporter [Anaerohalosphaera lusitana]
MTFIDWGIVVLLIGLMTWAAWHTTRYNRSVADFLAANRCAGRYIMGVSDGIANVGAISIIMVWEMYYRAGFSVAWWALVMLVVQVIVALTGWIAYRYRQSRALTLAQLLEMRYNKSFRIFCGFVLFISGTLNFGIFPAVGAKFFQHFCGLPKDIIWQVGPMEVDAVYLSIMLALLAISLYFTFAGGQITVMITDFIQGTTFNIALCLVIVFVMWKMPWADIMDSLSNKAAGESMIHPFRSAKTEDYNYSFYLIQALIIFWTFMAWQGAQGYFAAAKNAHEARMGRVMGNWRILTQQMLVLILPIAAYTMLHNPNWADMAAGAHQELNQIGNETIRTQVTTSVGLRYLLPVGLTGALSAVLLAAFISTHDTYLHSWGSIFIQDVVLPLRGGKPLDKKTHMRWLRYAIFGVAIFIFLFSLFFSQNDTIAMYFALTGTIWLGGAGAVIVGGLYTRWGTTAGAYAAVFGAIIIAVTIFTCQRIWPDLYHTVEKGRVSYLQLDGANESELNSKYNLEGSAEFVQGGRFDGALELDGKGYLTVDDFEGIGGTDARTVSYWINVEKPGTVLSWGREGDGKQWTMSVVRRVATEAGKEIETGVVRLDVGGATVTGNLNVMDGAWHHVAAVVDENRGTTVDDLELWIDGKFQERSKIENAELAIDTAGDTPVRLGTGIDGQAAFEGMIDEVSVYNRPVTRKLPDSDKAEPEESLHFEMDILKGLEFQKVSFAGMKLTVNSQWGMLYAMVSTAILYTVVSLLTMKKKFNLDKLLHRGKYALAEDETQVTDEPVKGLGTLIGMGKDFDLKDKIVYSSITGWSVVWGIVFIAGWIHNANTEGFSESTWGKFWQFYVWLSVVLGVITTVWFTIGGIKDAKDLFRTLETKVRNDADDGSVSHADEDDEDEGEAA